ncbi:vesicle-associated membrane protein 1 isoform X1 [Meles meles]|uniref:vesicle-associated membrane protein 1 isoform X1 n=1 Tax=Meles meles TaxID=9662 RepID=UPI001E69CB11|nr:vesicle-associated membrane protein 1 isoform X1 [Meles meles]
MSAPAQPPTEGAEGTAPGGGPPGPPPNTTSNRRLQQTQAQVEEVVDIMRVNVDKVLKRDEILSQLDDRADALQVGASRFETSAAKLKRKYWWKDCKGATTAAEFSLSRGSAALCDFSGILVLISVSILDFQRTSIFRGLAFYLPGLFLMIARWLPQLRHYVLTQTSSTQERRDKESQTLSPNDVFCPGKEDFPIYIIGQKWTSCPS